MKSVMEHGEVVERYLGEEQEAQRVLGPFKRSLFLEVHVSPFGVIPKADPGNGDSSSTSPPHVETVLTMELRKNYVLSHMSRLMT